MPDGYLADMSYSDRQERWETLFNEADADATKFILIAEDHGEIAGFANGGPARETDIADSEIYAIYVSTACQGKGHGRQLINRLATLLLGAGFKSAVVRVLAHNPSRRFYEALGGRHVSLEEISVGGVALEEMVYLWPSLRALVQYSK
jgi:L-amino acid N-acyltransferase YncA